MFSLNKAMQVLDEIWNAKPSGMALTWNTPVHFDPTLVARLIEQHRELNERFSALCGHLGKHPAAAEHSVRECADQLHELRRVEALLLYPVIARGFAPDPIARRLVWQSRLVMLGLARRVLRRFDELVRAIRNGTEINIAADHVAKALAEYQRRNETDMYPLYNLMERLHVAAPSQAA
jgi:hypothetical protein